MPPKSDMNETGGKIHPEAKFCSSWESVKPDKSNGSKNSVASRIDISIPDVLSCVRLFATPWIVACQAPLPV